eukprot:7839690-Pyramimonas_sp.AAC.1
MVTLPTQMRSVGDAMHAQMIERFRDVQGDTNGHFYPMSEEYLRSLQVLDKECVHDDPLWRFAPIAVVGNKERLLLNPMRAKDFAKASRQPIFRWRLNLSSSNKMKDWLFASSLNSDDDIARLYNEEPGMWFHFVVGAPVVLTFNHSVRFLLANGTPAIMHSFGYYDESKHGRAAQLMRDTLGGETADLDEPPDFICVELDTTDVDLYRDVTVIPGKPVIAIPLDRGNGKGKWTTEMGTCSEWSEKR